MTRQEQQHKLLETVVTEQQKQHSIYPFSLYMKKDGTNSLPLDNSDIQDKEEFLTLPNNIVILIKSNHNLQKNDVNFYILFFEWISHLWYQSIHSEFQGWDGTLVNIQEQINPMIFQSKSAYVLCLELYYHIKNLPIANDNDETTFLRNLFVLLISDEMDEVSLEHYSMLGLYFYLRRTMSYEGFQFLGNLPPTIRPDCMSSGDICRDFIHAVDAYFATQIVWKVIGISSQGSVIALSNKYEELMEMYFRIKCYLSNGLIKSSDQSNWKNIYNFILDIFRTTRSHTTETSDSHDVDESQGEES